MAKNAQYYQTESELAKLFSLTGLPSGFTNGFIKDYAAVKRTVEGSDSGIEQLQQEVDGLGGRLTSAESNIASINSSITSLNAQVSGLGGRVDLIEIDIPEIREDLDEHIADLSAHGATGDIVGTDDYCTSTVGGTVLLANALTQLTGSISYLAYAVAVAPAAYSQAHTQTIVDALTEIKTDFNELAANTANILTKVNQIITTQEIAKQRAT